MLAVGLPRVIRMQETDRQLRELGKQIGGLGDKFGYLSHAGRLVTSQQKYWSPAQAYNGMAGLTPLGGRSSFRAKFLRRLL